MLCNADGAAGSSGFVAANSRNTDRERTDLTGFSHLDCGGNVLRGPYCQSCSAKYGSFICFVFRCFFVLTMFVTLLIAGEDKGQMRPGLAAAVAAGEEIVVIERRRARR